ncbi:MAG TPA: EAL domain-containing protein [Minicystis sp.]|nr:EAL domain-containing protein [Minicystis sp.]
MSERTDLTTIRSVIDARAIRVALQPVVDLTTRKVFAYEALVRSQAPAFASPPDLFDAAVKEGLCGELGRIIREAAIEIAPDHRLFLNVHPNELNERWLVQPDDPIFRHGEDVFLEITESVPLSHFLLCQSMLREIRGKGIYLVVDDLGAGYSNLKYIADLSPRVVKLDRELVAGLVRGSRLHRLVESLVRLCRELDASVVAEGIETVEELAAICEAGVRFGQGYLLARPAFSPPAVTWPARLTGS